MLDAQELSSAVIARTARVTLPPVLGEWPSAPVAVALDLSEAGEEDARGQLHTALEECENSVVPQPEGCPFAAPEDVTAEGTWSVESPPLLTGPSGGKDGFFEYAATFVTAEFTAAGTGTGSSTVHRVEAIGMAYVVVDRDGRVHAQWALHHLSGAEASAAREDY